MFMITFPSTERCCSPLGFQLFVQVIVNSLFLKPGSLFFRYLIYLSPKQGPTFQLLLDVPMSHSKQWDDHSFAVTVPRMWNKSPLDIHTTGVGLGIQIGNSVFYYSY